GSGIDMGAYEQLPAVVMEREDIYVDRAMGDDVNIGTEEDPVATIARAQKLAPVSEDTPFTIHLMAGTYTESVGMKGYVSIVGEDPETTIIEGTVAGAEGTTLSGVTITTSDPGTRVIELLTIDEVSMAVDSVILNAMDNPFSYGMVITGTGSNDTIVTNCEFRRVGYGIHAVNTTARFRANKFEDIRHDALFVRSPETLMASEATEFVPVLGASDDEQTGNNIFGNIGGFFVWNATESEVMAENNDWGLCFQYAIAEKMNGLVDFMPFTVNGGEGEGEGEGEIRGPARIPCPMSASASGTAYSGHFRDLRDAESCLAQGSISTGVYYRLLSK
ncbi:hypothetical protein ACFL1X_04440, partial [Candidatus Hydrogenedentota bacterium]